jgi:hypothetical protein
LAEAHAFLDHADPKVGRTVHDSPLQVRVWMTENKSETDPDFTKPDIIWNGEQVQVGLTPALRAEALKYLSKSYQVLLANSIHVKGLRHDYKIAGKGTPLVIYEKNPESTPEEKQYPNSGIVLGITAVEKTRRGQLPLLKLYDSFDPTGEPILESAAQLREDLQATQRLFDPSRSAVPSHHVVVVAHRMGGLLAHTLVSDSGDALWNVFATMMESTALTELSPTTALIWREPSQKR